MFNWFNGSRKKSALAAVWNIDDIPGFEKIQNPDSVQYVNADGSKVIYFSVLTVSGRGDFLSGAYGGEPTTTENDDGTWTVKGTKKSKNIILVCLITLEVKENIEWAKSFFNSIKSREE